MTTKFRRLVTGHDETGASVFVMDGEPPTIFEVPSGATQVIELWETKQCPASNAGNDEATGGPMKLPPDPMGSKFRIVRYPPDSVRLAALKEGAKHHDEKRDGYARDHENKKHPGFHKTDTIDYAIVLDGEIYAILDKEERLMRAGDILIQRGTNHAWSNRTDAPVHVAFVLIDALPT